MVQRGFKETEMKKGLVELVEDFKKSRNAIWTTRKLSIGWWLPLGSS